MEPSIDGKPVAFDLDAAGAYIATARWKFATTMPDWPHEYTVKDWRPELIAEQLPDPTPAPQ